jgi:TPR repeat protein
MTMPTSMEPPRGQAFPPRSDSAAPFNGPPGRGMPPRPSTAQGGRGPPQRFPPNGGGYHGGYDEPNYNQMPQRPASLDDFYDNYYGPGGNEYGQNDMPNFDNSISQRPRGSFDQHMPGQQDLPHQGSGRVPQLNKTKSQPDLRQPQQAIFEMAGDIPPIPTVGGQYQQGGYDDTQYGGQGGFTPRGPGANGVGLPGGPDTGRRGSASGIGLPSGPNMGRRGSAASQGGSNPDALPSHPTPVRPGLMPNSVASQMVNKPAPVRNYGAPAAPAGTMSSASVPIQPVQAAGAPLDPPVTPELLERLRSTIKHDPNDQATALTLAKKLVEAISVLLPSLDPRSKAKARERYAMDAQKILKKLTNAQNPEAMFFMADCLGKGFFGPVPDDKEAFTLYQSAAKLGHAAAAYRTAVCCEIGSDVGGGTRKDPNKAIQWYRRAATLGDTPAMYKVGMILLKGLLGQPRNPREAVGWLKRAAERADAENPHALHELGLLYMSASPNDVILRDEAYAFTLFKQAADLGYKFSQFRMGCAYEYGLMGCPIDPRLSIMWYSKAATQEEHQSELALSGWYLTGSDGVLQQSDTEAYLWARKAAMAGLAKAEYAMGYFTEVGIGVPANLEDAKRWYWRAAGKSTWRLLSPST